MSEQVPDSMPAATQGNQSAINELTAATDYAEHVGALSNQVQRLDYNPDLDVSVDQPTFGDTHITTENIDGTESYAAVSGNTRNSFGAGSTFKQTAGRVDTVRAKVLDNAYTKVGDNGEYPASVEIKHKHASGEDITTNILTGNRAQRASEILMRRSARNIGSAATRDAMTKIESFNNKAS